MYCLCACMIMVRIIVANYGTPYTVDTRPSETKEHKIFHAPFTLFLQLGLPKISGAVPPAVLISLCVELAHVREFPLSSQFVVLPTYEGLHSSTYTTILAIAGMYCCKLGTCTYIVWFM